MERAPPRPTGAAKVSEWQPIETAPKGGKWMLLWWPWVTEMAFVGYEVGGVWYAAPTGDSWTQNGAANPTHWMPLPTPPQSKP